VPAKREQKIYAGPVGTNIPARGHSSNSVLISILPGVTSPGKVTGRVVACSPDIQEQAQKGLSATLKFVHCEMKSYMPCGILITIFLKLGGYSSPVFYET
jgi:hypothetical protein